MCSDFAHPNYPGHTTPNKVGRPIFEKTAREILTDLPRCRAPCIDRLMWGRATLGACKCSQLHAGVLRFRSSQLSRAGDAKQNGRCFRFRKPSSAPCRLPTIDGHWNGQPLYSMQNRLGNLLQHKDIADSEPLGHSSRNKPGGQISPITPYDSHLKIAILPGRRPGHVYRLKS
jgi:hypothetical protein